MIIFNPNPKGQRRDGRFNCVRCHAVKDTFDEARQCAIANWEATTGRTFQEAA